MQRLVAFVSTPVRTVAAVAAIWLAVGWLTGYLRPVDAALRTELPAWVKIPGLVAIVFGGALVLTCGAKLSKCGIGSLGGEDWLLPREFVATGPFRFVRNPMSLGATILMTGIALCHCSGLAIVLAAGLFAVFYAFIVWLEEPGLEKRFGDSYREYRRNVPRWIPRRTPWRQPGPERFAAPNGSPPKV